MTIESIDTMHVFQFLKSFQEIKVGALLSKTRALPGTYLIRD